MPRAFPACDGEATDALNREVPDVAKHVQTRTEDEL